MTSLTAPTLRVEGSILHWQGEPFDCAPLRALDDIDRLRHIATWMREVNERADQRRRQAEARALASPERY